MIKQLAEDVLPNVSKVTLILTGTSEKLNLALISDRKLELDIAPKPIAISGTASEVEAALKEAISLVFTSNKELFTNALQVSEDLKKEAAEMKEKNIKPKPKEKKVETEKEKPVKLNAAQKKVEKDIPEVVEKIKKASDSDMKDFLKNDILRRFEDVKMPESIKEAFLKQIEDCFEASDSNDVDEAEAESTPVESTSTESTPVEETETNLPEEVISDEEPADEKQEDDEDLLF